MALARCMRSHGVPNFPDPQSGHGLVIPNSINVQAPAFVSAQRDCNRAIIVAGAGSVPSESRKLSELRLARCIRRHGLPSFPDPTSNPSPAGGENAIGGGGAFLVVPNPPTPAFKHAASACGFHLPSG